MYNLRINTGESTGKTRIWHCVFTWNYAMIEELLNERITAKLQPRRKCFL